MGWPSSCDPTRRTCCERSRQCAGVCSGHTLPPHTPKQGRTRHRHLCGASCHLSPVLTSPFLSSDLSFSHGNVHYMFPASTFRRFFGNMAKAKYTLVLIRHGESTWNKENRFTGWTDVPLSPVGEQEAVEAAKALKEKGFEFDVAYTSVLQRAVVTCWTVLKGTDMCHIPVKSSWRLNERHYGALQGLNKAETAAKHGDEQVKIWRRSYDIPPPPLEKSDKRWPGNDAVYKMVPNEALPLTECLKDTVERVLPFWFDHIAPSIMEGKRVLVAAHGNSLRGLVKHLDKMSDEAVLELNIPTGVPLVYELDEDLQPVRHYYLLDEAELKAKMEAVANQGKAK
ncbi:phosphoglycerate mutase PGMII [Toxoplasma gondii TgCatPRC2]|uniref:Phosphoglycerate mutase n=13 Tax=Toxoplasma gondii TaxID=5811 RepID=A0A125YK30_TOXGV|nr:phosphoglycerate mutase PGMII [Toxoplasma gondii ME49]ESS29972.1 phosphoglycerate mutase PGMII [Toxoplasma gondii VEG]KFG29837.1 phosphoglycerate mutase PGMII [Toxoplasma gondii p89]KFG41842.1 phosphoglycerate mutase PGMII [Toxoplasma gondii GAB2-2007-GAL-DOM2]KFG61246.1 phosphoglycerate mutase PGMII [Toxoplasma gondii RUB]KFH00884.1 phosphoglycerate mutase PGMII [Toxoplasma gondii VAND]KFH04590.1 phosphoglycerate mutase PGMII [Toxoplasma gondii MAS]KYK69252.1 phosphoglycerate mutase PGMI|eukprot:XP_002371136.2 phosphoglycerate mutase PGMII [Toxoplasma gondii ME49]